MKLLHKIIIYLKPLLHKLLVRFGFRSKCCGAKKMSAKGYDNVICSECYRTLYYIWMP